MLDVAQSLSRVSRCTDAVPCVLPNSILWLRRQGRVVEPGEALFLQGLPMRTSNQLSLWTKAELMDLAGNAFCGGNVAALLLASLVEYTWPLATSKTAP